jgi:hypothetical protein
MAKAKPVVQPKPKPSRWRIDPVESGVHRVTLPPAVRSDMWVFLSADWHWDNTKCRLDVLERDLQTAKRIGAMVISAGDHFCAMQGKFDRRADKQALRPEHATGSYLDALVDTAAEFLKPYLGIMGLITIGNHESSIYARHETCLTTRLVERLRSAGSPCRAGGYNGWVQFYAASGRAVGIYRLYYHHGSGGDAPVTQGLLGMNRVSQYVDADAILSGHIHTKNLSTVVRERLSSNGIRRVSDTHLVRVSTYKDEYSPLVGWHIEQGRGPRPTSSPGYWLHLKMNRDKTRLIPTYHEQPLE